MHRWSKLFIPTLREAPADAEVASHKFLLRAGYIRQLGAGIYNYLFMGQRSLNKIIGIVRDEPRPKAGLLRVRQFIMKDSYSFDINKVGLDRSFDLHDRVYRSIFTRCGLRFVAVEADSGAMGGSQSQEFMVYTDAGEDLIASCPVCRYAANLEKATSRLDSVLEMAPTGGGSPELVHTPGCGAIADVAAFFKISPASDIKCVAYMASISGEWKPAVVFLRGDHQVSEAKLMGVLLRRN